MQLYLLTQFTRKVKSIFIIFLKKFKKKIQSETNSNTNSFGLASFYVNNGTHPQPGCLGLVQCSRDRAKIVWAESVRARNPIFPTLRCETWELFMSGACNINQPHNYMGIYASPTEFGRFMVQTNTREPWSRSSALPN
jgi:hypothetical protein